MHRCIATMGGAGEKSSPADERGRVGEPQPPDLHWADIIETDADAVIVVDCDRLIRYANPAVLDVLGYDPAELVGQPYDVLVPERLRSVHETHHRTYAEAPVARTMGRGGALRARRRDGTEIDVDIALVPLDGDDFTAAAFVRDITSIVRSIARLDATNALFRSALAGAQPAELEQLTVELALRVVVGSWSWFATSTASDDEARGALEVVAVSGDASGVRLGAVFEARGISGLDLDPHGSVRAADRVVDALGVDATAPESRPVTGTTLLVPISVDDRHALLAVGRDAGHAVDADFGAGDTETALTFADSVAVILELVDLRRQMSELAAIEEHDRIARDLHDSVIQRLFATAMRLESVLPTMSGPAAERVSDSVDELDGVIGDIRTVIFNLRRSPHHRAGLRAAVADEVDRGAVMLGFSPNLRFFGPIDAGVSAEVAAAVPMVVREALSNVARHAHARHVSVELDVDDDDLVVLVGDDGIGVSPDLPRQGGLVNLAARARELGGSLHLSRPELGGTMVEWRAPRRPLGSADQ